ncbi:helix-turn-helix transcriptional regulator [Abyssisolibacter fermentans]|uniref:helix-turn-helix transcriptional regulator n=1 Tax=Abyssisolibacter fermentans TaxID=1766203 RepID=UPI001FA7DE0F|nr:helix-turn-helix transcriptional regulator [Abyssisolibacter fermentans]
MIVIANHITKLRKKAGFYNVKQAALKLKISTSMLYQIESGYKRPSASLGMRMSYLFNCTLEDIFLPYNTTHSGNT